ncbi:MAG: U32 family peptidase [Actinobacteria bacterium]|nr:U32 family peptidase [Actinomycetota bacterium]
MSAQPAQPDTRPELLAPAGEPRALRAALSAGADAVYFGLERWSARAFAGNFAGDAVQEAVETAHMYDARAYLALNTLLKDEEIEPALAALEAPYRAGLDALIVADLGFAACVREEYPGLALHASTQLNTHGSAQLAALRRLGFSRAILARELSIAEIAALDACGLELEAFVHGALCYGYSGDCLLSSMVGGRSGNRGRCSQSCRMRYALRRRGRAPLEASRIMSTSDLAAVSVLPDLLAAGVVSFKIEGRMKAAVYVGVTTSVYREALDAAVADPQGFWVRPEWSARLEQSFSRSFTTAHLEGRHDEVRSGGRGGHRGVLVGRVSRIDDDAGTVEVRLTKPVAEGDVVYLYTPWGQTEPQRLEVGGGERLTLRVRERVAVKDRLFRLSAADVGELGRDLATGRVALRPLRLRLRLSGEEGAPAELVATELDSGTSVAVRTAEPLVAARTAALGEGRARDALGALGGTPYELADLEFAVAGDVFLAVGALKELRRRAVAELAERRVAARRRSSGRRIVRSHPSPPVPGTLHAEPAAPRPGAAAPDPPPVVVRLRPGEAPLPLPPGGAWCLDVASGDEPAAVARALEVLQAQGASVRLRLPEALFDGQEPWLTALLTLPWDAVVVRTVGLPARVEQPLVLEYPLQGLNGLAAAVVAELAGRQPAAVTLSPEVSLVEIPATARILAPATPALEILAFGRQQVMHTRDLLGRAEGLYEAPGPAEHVSLVLEDAKGYEFPAQADAGGTRIFNARVTNLAPNLGELREAGVATFVVEQAAMEEAERAAFAAGGLEALAPLASRERSTTGHLFRGVA